MRRQIKMHGLIAGHMVAIRRTVVKKVTALLLMSVLAGNSYSQTDSLIQRIFLIGDAGQLQGNNHPVLDWLSKNVNWNDEKNVALFLGDNIYPDGLPDEGDAEYEYTKKVIDYQLNLFKGKKAKAFFVPGNHDWKGGKIGGWERGVNQVNYINSLQAPNIQAWPLNGCPGPIPIELNEKVVLVMMNSQWFLHVHDKPGLESSCEARTIDEFKAELQEIADTHPNQLLVLVMHHPMYTYGTHGGAYGLKQHIFPFAEAIKGAYIPLPILGSAYPVARGFFGSLQDTYHPLYKTMINEIEEVLKSHPNPIAVAGHEHSLQLIVKDSIPYIVSGSAAKLTRLRKGKNSVFSILDYGFSMLEIWKSGKVETKFYNLQSNGLEAPIYSKDLKPVIAVTPKASFDTLLPVFGNVETYPGTRIRTSTVSRFLWGKNYSEEWNQKISLPMLDLGKEAGGLRPVRQQGGSRTRFLSLSEKKGKEWTLRSIETFPESVIPSDLRSGLQIKYLSNGVSGAYPYAALSVPILENAVGIPSLRRKLVYVPDDPRLERFRSGFKNTLGLLEEKEPAVMGKTFTTEDLFLLIIKNNEDRINQKAVLNARLMDNFVMDFDRHEGKWRWGTKDTIKGKVYFPIPYDHDHAFFKSEGLLNFWLRQPWFIPELQGFRAAAHNIKTFNKAARNFDRSFLNELTLDDWEKQIDQFLASMKEEVIIKALEQQPPDIQNYAGIEIVNTLKKRKEFFRKEMLDYYRFISKKVDIVGSNQRELFSISQLDNGEIKVTVNKMQSTGVVSTKMYERIFDPSITKELRLYALEADDSIVLVGDPSRILIRIIGGPGIDHFAIGKSAKRIIVYDAAFEKNTISGTSKIKNKIINNPEVNRYNRLDYRYDFPKPSFEIEYNIDNGLSLAVQFEYFKQGFRKEPYGMKQVTQLRKAFQTGAFQLFYEGIYVKALKDKMDLIVRADLKGPAFVSNFFGAGINSVFDRSNGGIQYYQVRNNESNFAILAGKQLQSWMRVEIGPSMQFLSLNKEKNTAGFISDFINNGLNESTIFKRKAFLGLEARLDINSKNNAVIPTRGAVLKGYARQLFGVNSVSRSVLQVGLDLRIFMSVAPETRFVFATRFGAGRNIGNYEFQQAQYLGGTENLRGWRKDRFGGRSIFFNNSEIRTRLFNFSTYIFQGSAGILAFHDIGRVWFKGTGKWYTGYGGGIWLSPMKRLVVVGSLVFSKEEKGLPMLTFGFQF